MKLSDAIPIAEEIKLALELTCHRVMICGSIRRKQPEVSDIDIVCVPMRDIEKDMFGAVVATPVIPGFYNWVSQWPKIKGDPNGKMTARLIKGVQVELSIATPANFGNMCLIRTGDAEFCQMIMKRVRSLGFEQRNGMLYDEDRVIPITEEEHYFSFLNLPYIEPENRTKDAFR